MSQCRLCSKSFSEDQIERGMCTACRQRHALPGAANTPPRRPAVPCARCGAGSFVRGLVLRDNTVIPHMDANIPAIDAMAITYGARAVDRGVFVTHREIEVDVGTRYGLIESYTCRTCGFIELYARDPAAIPIGEAYGTELFEVPGKTYRT